MIDPQRAFVASQGSLARAVGADELALSQTVAASLPAFIATFREQGEVIFIRSEYRPGQFSTEPPLDRLCLPGSLDAEWLDGLAPEPGDAVFTKHEPSAYTVATLRDYLRGFGGKFGGEIHLCGFQLTSRVRETAPDLERMLGHTGVYIVLHRDYCGLRRSSLQRGAVGEPSRLQKTLRDLQAAGVELV